MLAGHLVVQMVTFLNKIMNTSNKSVSVEGLVTLNKKATDSPLRVGELLTYRPFAALAGIDMNKLQCIKVSDEKLYSVTSKTRKLQKKDVIVTLVKKVTEDTINFQPDYRAVEKVLGKQPIKVDGKLRAPKLTFNEIVIVSMAEIALDKFGSLQNVDFTVSLYGGTEIKHKF